MERKQNSPVFFIILIATVIIMIIGIIFITRKDAEEVKNTQERIEAAESQAEDLGQAVQEMDAGLQQEYDELDEGIGY